MSTVYFLFISTFVVLLFISLLQRSTIEILHGLLSWLFLKIVTSFLSCKHSLKKSGLAWRNIEKYVTVNPNHTVSLSEFRSFKNIHQYAVSVVFFAVHVWPARRRSSIVAMLTLQPRAVASRLRRYNVEVLGVLVPDFLSISFRLFYFFSDQPTENQEYAFESK